MMGCPYCGNGSEKKGEYKEMASMEDDSSIKDSVLAELMETMSKGMGSKLKGVKPMAMSIEIAKPANKMSEYEEEEEEG